MHKKIPNIFTFISSFKKEEISNLHRNIGIIFRNYTEEYDKNKILEIKQFCKSNNRKFYLSNNIKLAFNLNLDGVYIPAFNKNLFIQKYNLRKNFLIMGSAHNIFEIKEKENQGVELIFLSPIFKTKNNKKGLEIIKFNNLARLSTKKIIALGGISKKNIIKLKIANIYGFSGISYFLNKL